MGLFASRAHFSLLASNVTDLSVPPSVWIVWPMWAEWGRCSIIATHRSIEDGPSSRFKCYVVCDRSQIAEGPHPSLPLLSVNATSVQMFLPEVVRYTMTLSKSSPALHADSTCVFILMLLRTEALCKIASGVLLHNLPCDSYPALWKQIPLKERHEMNNGLRQPEKPKPTLWFLFLI